MNSAVDIRRELDRLQEMPPWQRVQHDAWDRASRFIYDVRDLETLGKKTKSVADAMNVSRYDFGSYVIHRWYDFHTHEVTLEIIAAHPSTRRGRNRYNHEVDFYLSECPFDLKLTRFPRGFSHSIEHAKTNAGELARWLYVHQSRQGRFHCANRLFVVFHDAATPDQSWKLRRDFARIERVIYAFFDEPELLQISFTDHQGRRHQPTTGVIFCVKE